MTTRSTIGPIEFIGDKNDIALVEPPVRNQLWGHVFGGRYKAVLVENREFGSGDYLSNLIDYVHLNPIRAGILNGTNQSLIDYPWSSLSRGYAVSPQKRPGWLTTDDGFGILGLNA